jgi:uncharacterized protein (TIGR02147 family)
MLSIFDYDSYRQYLRDALAERTRVNSSFSLRSFARMTGLSASHLSRTLSQEKRLSVTSARQIAMALNLTVDESDYFLSLVEVEAAPTPERKAKILRKVSRSGRGRPEIVPIEAFRIVADWYHFAILALTNTRGFRSDPIWIARRLGIKPQEAKAALERLLTVGLLVADGKSVKAANDANISTSDDITSAAIQENHLQHLKKAGEALSSIDAELREFNNVTFSMKLSDVKKAKKLLRDFILRFNSEMETPGGDEIFQMNFQMYPISQIERGRA